VNVLLDGCVWGGAREALSTAGHEVESTADWPTDPGDAEVLAHAHRSGQVLITLDKDFGPSSLWLVWLRVTFPRVAPPASINGGTPPRVTG
jgi:predicted nuclease of predicted toxin-antitoxin system